MKWLGHRDLCPTQWGEPCNCRCEEPDCPGVDGCKHPDCLSVIAAKESRQ